MSDPSGPRRIVPVPGVVDLDAVEDANLAEAFGEDLSTDESDLGAPPAPPLLSANDPPADDEAVEGHATDAPTLPGTSGVSDNTQHQKPDADAPEESPLPTGEGQSLPRTRSGGEGPSDVAPPTSGFPDDPTAPPPVDTDPTPVDTPAALVPAPDVVETAKTVTRDRGRELVQLVVKYGKDHVPETPAKVAEPDTGPPRMVGRVGQLIPFLRVIPWLLAALFALSFWWDFDGQAVSIVGRVFEIEGLLKVLTVSGLIGFGTNWLAITMLFQPREKRAIIPQGLIPAQRERVIYRLSQAISKELINADIIKQKIQESGVIGRYRDLAVGVVRGVVEDPDFRTDLKTIAQGYAQEVLGSEPVRREVARLAVSKVEEQAGGGLGGVALRLYRTFAEDDFQRRVDRALDELPDAVIPLLDRIDTALDAVPQKVEAHADEIEEVATSAVLSFVEGFDVQSMIREKARGFDEGQLENLLKSTSNEQLNYIKYLGAILGVFGGFIIWEPLGALAVFLSVSLALWAIDEALVRARRS